MFVERKFDKFLLIIAEVIYNWTRLREIEFISMISMRCCNWLKITDVWVIELRLIFDQILKDFETIWNMKHHFTIFPSKAETFTHHSWNFLAKYFSMNFNEFLPAWILKSLLFIENFYSSPGDDKIFSTWSIQCWKYE
jgi:hypothetical protein